MIDSANVEQLIYHGKYFLLFSWLFLFLTPFFRIGVKIACEYYTLLG